MKGCVKNLIICGYRCTLYLPGKYDADKISYPVVYINGGDNIDELISCVESHFESDCQAFIAVSIQPENWQHSFTPWPAPALTPKSEPFAGEADVYLNALTDKIKPYIDEHYRTQPEAEGTAVIGYSLGGLTALYALYTSGAFGKIGSLSGSLWYDRWIKFMDSNLPVNKNAKIYISLGKGEERNRNQVMARVGDCTLKAVEILKRQVSYEKNIEFEWNDGGHFTEIPKRFKKALLWLMKKQ